MHGFPFAFQFLCGIFIVQLMNLARFDFAACTSHYNAIATDRTFRPTQALTQSRSLGAPRKSRENGLIRETILNAREREAVLRSIAR